METQVVTTDPVCGMQVEPGKEAGRFVLKGKTYLLCSKHCLQAFSAECAPSGRDTKAEEAAGCSTLRKNAKWTRVVK